MSIIRDQIIGGRSFNFTGVLLRYARPNGESALTRQFV